MTTTSSVNSPEDVINIALAEVGHPARIGSVYDGSRAARLALDVYAQSRDEVLRAKDWSFALRSETGIGGTTTIAGWAFAWAYPAGCIRVRSVQPFTPSLLDPAPILWTIFNNQFTVPNTRVILTQVTPVTINYVGQITDMATWDPLFTAAVVERLAQRMTPSLRKEIAPSIDPVAAVTVAARADEALSPNDAEMGMSAPQPQQARRG